jgi:hypothetical protein
MVMILLPPNADFDHHRALPPGLNLDIRVGGRIGLVGISGYIPKRQATLLP